MAKKKNLPVFIVASDHGEYDTISAGSEEEAAEIYFEKSSIDGFEKIHVWKFDDAKSFRARFKVELIKK